MFITEQAAAYLAAMIDGEGWIGEPKGAQNRAIRIANTDRVLIDAIAECCDVLGVHYTVQSIRARQDNWSDGWVVDITGHDSLRYILDHVPFRAPRKRDRLARQVASYAHPPLDPETLTELYESGLTVRQVAAELGISAKRVANAMRKHGIARRTGADRATTVWEARRARYGPTGRSSCPDVSTPA
jgi:intein/homing endonuclease